MFAKLMSVAVLVLLAFTTPIASASESKKPEVFGVLFYADWCSSCKILDPKLNQVKDRHDLEDDSILFLTLDFTDDTTTSQAAQLVNAVGMDEVYAQYGDKTGFMLLVDAQSKKVISRITKRMSNSEVATKIQQALKLAKG